MSDNGGWSENEVHRRVERIVGDVLGYDALALKAETTAAEVDGWDSLANVQIFVALEKAFAIRFRVGEMTSVENVGALVRRIAARLDGATVRPGT